MWINMEKQTNIESGEQQKKKKIVFNVDYSIECQVHARRPKYET